MIRNEDWLQRWQQERLGFHLTKVNPLLMRYGPRILRKPGRVLVPLCGKSLDLLWLAQQGHEVLGVELAGEAVPALEAQSGCSFQRQQPPQGLAEAVAGQLRVLTGDFFELSSEQAGEIDAVYDRAALVAVDPSRQGEYVRKLSELAPQAPLLLVGLYYDSREMNGPPFSLPQERAFLLLQDRYRIELLEEEEVLAANEGLRRRGLTWLREYVLYLEPRSGVGRE
jgi:thiopurine S-methyltransferase